MDNQNYSMFTGTLIKQDGKLVPINKNTNTKYNAFLKSLLENQSVEIFIDANKDDGTLAQLAKIHACIRKIAESTGNDLLVIKKEIKTRSGLSTSIKTTDERKNIKYKSFAKCSKEELNLVINNIIELGDLLTINFR
jgi:hypothetical protein